MNGFLKSSLRAIRALGIWIYRYGLRLLPYHVTWIIVLVGVYDLSRRIASFFAWGMAGFAVLIPLNVAAVVLTVYEFEERFFPALHSRSPAMARAVRGGQWIIIALYLSVIAFGTASLVQAYLDQSP